MKKKRYLPLYYKWMETGFMPEGGLCSSLLFINENMHDEFIENFKNNLSGYWGYNGKSTANMQSTNPKRCVLFTPLRQNIVLLMAAMNGEL